MMEEWFDIYDSAGNRVGQAPRRECHGNPSLLHHTSHVVVFHPDGKRILLQKRALTKDIQPGKWDTAVGGHLALGEDFEAGAKRELAEELGWKEPVDLRYLFDMKIRNGIESEDVRVFGTTLAGPFNFLREEIDEVRFWSANELKDTSFYSLFTPNLVKELQLLFAGGFL